MASITISKRGNKYQYKFEIAKVNGKRKYINKCGFKTKAEAYEAGVEAYNEYKTAGVPFKECNMSYSDYLDYWIENYCKTNLKYNTISCYETLIRLYIKPRIGMFKLSTITGIALNEYITNLVKEYDLSRTYFKNILKVVKGSFRDACNLYGFIKYNPAQQIRLPKIDRIERDPKHLYEQKDIDMILEQFKDDAPFIGAFLVGCFTGMRTGEIFALTWNDIDLDNGIINIQHNVYDKKDDGKGRWYIGTTKTNTGTRQIFIGNILIEALKKFKQRQDELKKLYGKDYIYYHLEDVKNEYGKSVENRIVINNNNYENEILNLVFTKDNGKYVGTDLLRYPFKKIHKELNLKDYRFYDLRGSYATKSVNNGSAMKDVSELLGHKDPSTTQKYYINSNEESKKKVTEIVDKIINSNVINNAIKFEL